MKKVCLWCWIFMIVLADVNAQSIADKLKTAVDQLEKDPQLRNGIMSLYVADATTGKPVFERNAQLGLAPASTQKVITSITAFELLGKSFRYNTRLGYHGKIENGVLKGDLYITGSGDPTLGSWRFASTKEENILAFIVKTLNEQKVQRVEGYIFIDESDFSIQTVPDGWIWQDIGNYYGAGAWGFNWKENQYDLVLRPGNKIGDTTRVIARGNRERELFQLSNTITTAQKESGDNGYIYLAPYSTLGFTTGTIPMGKDFTISGSMPNPPRQFSRQLDDYLNRHNIKAEKGFKFYIDKLSSGTEWTKSKYSLDSIQSPKLDSINYWFLMKSINLYGEALIKTIAKQSTGFGSTEKGVQLMKDFWSKRGIASSAMNIFDGSGLSPQNRVTAHALGNVLFFARGRPWFQSFYDALPVFNGMKIKSGSISGARSFAGYHRSNGGKEYIVAIIVNNYNGSSADIVKKMYRVLDVLK